MGRAVPGSADIGQFVHARCGGCDCVLSEALPSHLQFTELSRTACQAAAHCVCRAWPAALQVPRHIRRVLGGSCSVIGMLLQPGVSNLWCERRALRMLLEAYLSSGAVGARQEAAHAMPAA